MRYDDAYAKGREDEKADVLKYLRDVQVMHEHTSATVKGEKVKARHHAEAMDWSAEAIQGNIHRPQRVVCEGDDWWVNKLAEAKAWKAEQEALRQADET